MTIKIVLMLISKWQCPSLGGLSVPRRLLGLARLEWVTQGNFRVLCAYSFVALSEIAPVYQNKTELREVETDKFSHENAHSCRNPLGTTHRNCRDRHYRKWQNIRRNRERLVDSGDNGVSRFHQ